MTRVLSELLGAREPMFQRSLMRLESASGHNSTDVRLTTEIQQSLYYKLRQLGLDPKDTTGEELYHALAERLKADDKRLSVSLAQKYGSTSKYPSAHVAEALNTVPVPRSVYALKNTALKRILKKTPPKSVMKQLGYRSFDSMLKHEQPAALMAASWLTESAAWRKSTTEQYKKLKASDFEIRSLHVVCPDGKRWEGLTKQLVKAHKHTVISAKELGTIVLLPTGEEPPLAVTTVTLLLALHAMNEVRAASTFLKLCQVKPDFGKTVAEIVADDPVLDADIFDSSVPWHIIQRYYARFKDRFRGEIFEPHVQQEDLAWHNIERILTHIEPSMEFWRHTTTLSLLQDHQPVSLNVIDVALNYCNQLPYKNRIVHYFRHSLWHELLIRYLKNDAVEQTVLSGLQSKLVVEEITV